MRLILGAFFAADGANAPNRVDFILSVLVPEDPSPLARFQACR